MHSMPTFYAPGFPFMHKIREGPTSALEHIRTLYRTPTFLDMPKPVSDDPDTIALAIEPELKRACFESEILLLFADMMNDPAFMRHSSLFALSVARCTQILFRAWLLDLLDKNENRFPPKMTLMSIDSAATFWHKLESACTTFWNDRAFISGLRDRNTGVILAELQGILCTLHTMKLQSAIMGRLRSKPDISTALVKTAVLFFVLSHINIVGKAEDYFRRIYTGSCEGTLALLSYMFAMRRHHRTSGDADALSKYDQALAEIMQDVGAGPLLRAILEGMMQARLANGFLRLRDCLSVCSELYHDSGEASFREVYLQMPVQPTMKAMLKPMMPHSVNGDDPETDRPALQTYEIAWNHMSIIGTALRTGGISPSLIDLGFVWGLMLECVTALMETSIKIHLNEHMDVDSRNEDVATLAPYLQSFETSLHDGMRIWIDGARGSKDSGLGGGFPKTTVDRLVDRRLEGASMWYGFIATTRGRFPSGTITVPSVTRLLDMWMEWGTALGLDEEKERVWQAACTCSWRACINSIVPAPKPLMVCKGCHETRYCSAACQKSDWKQGGHRVKCRRLKA
ncbi:unnamed protein product [Peniophora sp. CBMAI 1063]|nr:unnamed protein product [Peniophora sp. CBMAI 1063]